MIRLSDAAYRLKGQAMFQILTRVKELERQGQEVLHFELGDPDFDTPANIVDAACRALKGGETHYVPSTGLREFKEAAAEVTLASRNFRPDPDQLLVCPGANVMIYYALACAVNPGEEVIVPDPGFVSYFSIMDYLGIKAVRVALREEEEFRLNPEQVARAVTANTRMIIINSPSNPTGSLMSETEIREIYQIAERHNLLVLSDEIYARMVYSDNVEKFFSISSIDACRERSIIVNGFSKSYAMTGWRLGVMTGPSALVEKMCLLLETTTSCVAPFLQRAGIEALRGSQQEVVKMVREYQYRRDVMVQGLNTLPGVTCIVPKGAFYAFANIRGTGYSSNDFCNVMLERGGVAMTPGPVFGEHGEGYVRLCYVNSVQTIEKAIIRMREVLTASG